MLITTNIRVARMVRLENAEKYAGGEHDGVRERRGRRNPMGFISRQ
jgi:hypothetical protein